MNRLCVHMINTKYTVELQYMHVYMYILMRTHIWNVMCIYDYAYEQLNFLLYENPYATELTLFALGVEL